ncbi:NUDIX hydrolase family protein [Janibacter limosus]|uniref:NUDIX hydrolase family protein n=1 Tax=Janibacter limosus TaxID=53458 RepID=UPI0035E23B13|nr:NUDIX hydrolase family protein [Janibacter limosus]
MQADLDRQEAWLSHEELDSVRGRVPILYVAAVPVRVADNGDVVAVGLLLRASDSGTMDRELIAGRVNYHERVRDALVRHLEKDRGPMALPSVPASPVPFTVAEFFPTPGVTPFHDPRQHAVALSYIVPVRGDCAPQHDALDSARLTPDEASETGLQAEMAGGHGALLRQAPAHPGLSAF